MLYVKNHLHGAKNGKGVGMRLNIVAIAVANKMEIVKILIREGGAKRHLP